jgi:diketogulonate reductase-like aldo/keto reductase
LAKVAARHGVTVGQVMLAWCLRNPIVFAVPKSSRVERVRENAAAANLSLTSDDLAEIDRDFPAPRRSAPLETL